MKKKYMNKKNDKIKIIKYIIYISKKYINRHII